MADVLAKLPGLRVDAREVRAKLGFSDPGADAEILGGSPSGRDEPGAGPTSMSDHAMATARPVQALATATQADRGDAIDRAVENPIGGDGWAPFMEPAIAIPRSPISPTAAIWQPPVPALRNRWPR